jgi:hypothetical protein
MILPWKMMMAPVADSMTEVAASASQAALVSIDTPRPQEIGTSVTDFRETPALQLPARLTVPFCRS